MRNSCAARRSPKCGDSDDNGDGDGDRGDDRGGDRGGDGDGGGINYVVLLCYLLLFITEPYLDGVFADVVVVVHRFHHHRTPHPHRLINLIETLNRLEVSRCDVGKARLRRGVVESKPSLGTVVGTDKPYALLRIVFFGVVVDVVVADVDDDWHWFLLFDGLDWVGFD